MVEDFGNSYSSQTFFLATLKKKLFQVASMYTSIGLEDFFDFLIYTLLKSGFCLVRYKFEVLLPTVLKI